MTIKEFEKLMKEDIFPACEKIMQSKGLSYSGLKDKLGNFKRGSDLSGASIEQVWFVYFTKHFDALSSYIRGEYSDSEPIKGRILDLINYLYLLCGILKEKGKLK